MTYVTGFLTPVETHRRDAYLASARAAWSLFRDYGALELVENWGDRVPAGEHTDMRRAVALEEGETVVFSWVRWPDRATADRCEAAMQTDPRFAALDAPFDATRIIYGGFETVLAETG